MPFDGIAAAVWLALVLGVAFWGQRRGKSSWWIKGFQSVITLAVLVSVGPTLGLFKTFIALLWLSLFLVTVSFFRKILHTSHIPYGAGLIAVLLTFMGSDTLNAILLRTIILLMIGLIFNLGFNLGFRYLIRRVLWIIPVLFAVTVITFGFMHSVPGGPFDAGGETGGIPLTPEVRANLMRKYNLDKPLHIQYVSWIRSVLQGDLGFSFQHQSRTCQEIIVDAWPVSVHLGGMALVVALIGGLTLGILAAVYQNQWMDHFASLVAILSIVTPSFVIAVGLTLIFTLWLHWFETGGWNTPKDWVMPVLAMSLGPMAVIARQTRSNMIDVIRADYVRTARAKGMKDLRIVIVHVLKNALIPLITITGPITGGLITGSFFIETIFRIPGIGRYFTTSVFARDYPMIMATALLWSSLIVVIYLLTDILYALVDPRIRYRKG